MYGITFTTVGNAQWSLSNQAKVIVGAIAVGSAFARTMGTSDGAAAFRSVYGLNDGRTFTFEFDPNSPNCSTYNGKPAGGFTHSSNYVTIATLWNNSPGQWGINNVVHELGHAFDNLSVWDMGPKMGNMRVASEIYLGLYTYGKDPTFPRRIDGLAGFYGFASDTMLWQQNPSSAVNEEFADMFLGWTFNQWENAEAGQRRSDFMNGVMPFTIDLALDRWE